MRDLELLKKKITKKINKLDKLACNDLLDNYERCEIWGRIIAFKKTLDMIDKMIKKKQKRIYDSFRQYEDDLDDIF